MPDVGRVSRVSVVIPYFQRKPGLLRRALQSVYEQELGSDIVVDVIVVDDESPISPETEAEGLSRTGVSLRIVKRPNGGPARARNTGLDAAAGADFVAFLDSDDWWLPRHLAVGLGALRSGSQFYFTNNILEDSRLWFDELPSKDKLIAAASPQVEDAMQISSEALMPIFLRDYLAHTSTVILDARRLGDLRFDEALESAGEDYLFWLNAVARSKAASFCVTPMVLRGRGMDLYRGSYGWDNPAHIRRLYSDLLMRKKALAFCRTKDERAYALSEINHVRRIVFFLLVRNAFSQWRTNAWVAWRLLRNDGGFWLTLPRNAYIVITRRLQGDLTVVR